MHLLLTRPAQDSARLAETLHAHGIKTTIEPVMDILCLPDVAVDLDGVQGLLVTSANGIRAFAARCERRDIAVWTVGRGSAEVTRQRGFSSVKSADGDVSSLASRIRNDVDPAAGALLHIAGTHLAGDLGTTLADMGYDYRRVVLYEARARETMTADAREKLGNGDVTGVALYSPRAARLFCDALHREGLAWRAGTLQVFCLSTAVAEAVSSLNWAETLVAMEPSEDSLLSRVLQAATTR